MSVDLNLYTPSKCIQMSISFGLFVDFVFVYKSLFEEILNKVPGFLRIHKIIIFFLKNENKSIYSYPNVYYEFTNNQLS